MKILWASPFNLHDTSSGAALQIRIMLQQLRTRGVEPMVLAGFIFDHPAGASFFPKLKEDFEASPDTVFFSLEQEGIKYQYMRTGSTNVSALTDAEQRKFFYRYCELLGSFRPDIVIMYGGGVMEMAMRGEAKRRGIPVVYTLFNGNHAGFTFPDVDMVVTDSQATADLYAKRDRIVVEVTGVFIDPANVVAQKREPKYITFVNPVPAKGVGIVARVAQLAQQAMPDEKFLIVQSRGDWFQVLPQLKNGETPLDPKDFPNVDVTDHAKDMRPVFAASKVLIAPSLWYESFGRVACEACMNGVPVVASTSGGLPDSIGDGGILIETPERLRRNHAEVATAEEAQPWLEALQTILASPEALQNWSNKAREASKRHALERSTDRTMELLAPLFARKAGSNPKLLMNSSFSR